MNGYGFDYLNYIANVPGNMNYVNVKPDMMSSYGYMNQPNSKQNYINYDTSKNISSKARPLINRRVNSSM